MGLEWTRPGGLKLKKKKKITVSTLQMLDSKFVPICKANTLMCIRTA